MGAGLVMGLNNGQKLILVSALKNNFSIETEIKQLLEPGEWQDKSIEINFDYHFGGFAKKNAELFAFMNSFYEEHQIPTDFVYTGKLAFAFNDMLMKDKFSNGAKVLLIHSGGLQGNRSLKNKELIF
jgi:1-aminocyclopropane-1-carboxylate deaminase